MDTNADTPLIRMAKVLWEKLGPKLGDERTWVDLGEVERTACVDALAAAIYSNEHDLNAVRRVMPEMG